MCNRYNIKTNLRELASEMEVSDAEVQIAFEFQYAEEIFPGAIAPVLAINREGTLQLRPMTFGFGNQVGGGAALNNARVESIEKWTWKKSFQKYRCVVPMHSFREPCYWGAQAGTEVNFAEADGKVLLAAAIFSFAKSDAGPAECSMSLVMRPAIPFVMEHGHHRSPFFLRRDAVTRWMDRSPMSIDQVRGVLFSGVDQPTLRFDVAREMATSWTRRQAANQRKRDQQLSQMKETGPLGLGIQFGGDFGTADAGA